MVSLLMAMDDDQELESSVILTRSEEDRLRRGVCLSSVR